MIPDPSAKSEPEYFFNDSFTEADLQRLYEISPYRLVDGILQEDEEFQKLRVLADCNKNADFKEKKMIQNPDFVPLTTVALSSKPASLGFEFALKQGSVLVDEVKVSVPE